MIRAAEIVVKHIQDLAHELAATPAVAIYITVVNTKRS